MIKSYEQFKSKIFNNKDQLRDMLNILYNVDKLRPMVIDAYNVIEQVEREKKNQKVKKALLNNINDVYVLLIWKKITPITIFYHHHHHEIQQQTM